MHRLKCFFSDHFIAFVVLEPWRQTPAFKPKMSRNGFKPHDPRWASVSGRLCFPLHTCSPIPTPTARRSHSGLFPRVCRSSYWVITYRCAAPLQQSVHTDGAGRRTFVERQSCVGTVLIRVGSLIKQLSLTVLYQAAVFVKEKKKLLAANHSEIKRICFSALWLWFWPEK